MIFYFSGTGNSQGIAEIVAKALGDQAVDIIGANPEDYHFTPDDYLGFSFPVYAYAAPEVMLEFASRLAPGGAFTFGICTFSNAAGRTMEHFSTILPLKAGYGVKMPDNYPVLERILETEESAIQKLTAAAPRVEEIIQRLKQRGEGFDVLVGEDGENRSFNLSIQFNKNKRKTAPYWVDKDLCTSCGLCESLCPAKAIELKNGYPVWVKEDCYLCMACINRCPSIAIEFGTYSKGRFRYYFKGFDTSVYFND